MAVECKIEVFKRELSNKKSFMKLFRKENKIPGIYYSHDSSESVPLYITKESLIKAQKSGAKIFNIQVGKDVKNVIFKSMQFHPVTEEILHLDLYGVDMKRAVTVKVAIILIGTAKGIIEEGGVLVQSLNEIEIECLPLDIPDSFKVNIEDLAIGDSIKVENIEIDEKFELKTNINQTIASVTHAMKEEELIPDTEEAEDEEFMEEGEEGVEGADEEGGDIAKDDSANEKKDDSEKK